MNKTLNAHTLAVHAGQHPDPEFGALAAPIYQTSTFAYGSFDRGAGIFAGDTPGYVYSRMANPTVAMLEQKIAALEGAETAVAFASGTGAVSALLLTLLNPDDEVLFVAPLYGGTESQLRDLVPRFGIRSVSVPNVAALSTAITAQTRLIYVETPMNPTLGIVDLREVARIAQQHHLISVVDNTFATPILTQPLTLGIDLVLHSATKYIGGHGDATGGIIAGAHQHLDRIRSVGMKQIGACMSPQDAYLFIRG
ncbi:MAG: PLP-dependent aspartate aminotransferase family protein, partial [Herbaspirillum sp.]